MRKATVVGAALLTVFSAGSVAAAASGERHVTLLHIADTHAQLETHPEYLPGEKPELQMMGGYARLKTAIDRERAHPDGSVFLADGGDTFQGSAPAAWSTGDAVLAPFNALGIDVCVPGNWEVVYGPERLRQLMKAVTCKVLAYNFHDVATGRRLFDPAVTLTRDGVKVAFVGITDPTTTKRQPPDEVRGLDSTRMTGLREFVKELRKREHPDLVVAVDHTGLTVSRQIAREIPEFDVILSGHTHERTDHSILVGKVIVVEPGSMGSFLGRLDLTIGPAGGITNHKFRLISVKASEYPEDGKVKELVEKAIAPYRARMDKVAGRSETTILRYDVLETNADNFIADVVRESAHTDIGLTNGFRYAPPHPAGPITEGALWDLLPLDARIKTGWVTGQELRSYLESELELVFSTDPWKLSGGWGPRFSGMKLKFDAKAKMGKRVLAVEIAGKPLVDTAHYTIAGCERAGEPLDVICRLRGAHDPAVSAPSVHEALRTYLTAHPTIAPRREGRALAVDLPAQVFSQDQVIQGFAH